MKESLSGRFTTGKIVKKPKTTESRGNLRLDKTGTASARYQAFPCKRPGGGIETVPDLDAAAFPFQAAGIPFSDISSASSPLSYISIMMSDPPTNSPFT